MSLIPFMTRFVFDYVFTRHRYIEYFPRLKTNRRDGGKLYDGVFFFAFIG